MNNKKLPSLMGFVEFDPTLKGGLSIAERLLKQANSQFDLAAKSRESKPIEDLVGDLGSLIKRLKSMSPKRETVDDTFCGECVALGILISELARLIKVNPKGEVRRLARKFHFSMLKKGKKQPSAKEVLQHVSEKIKGCSWSNSFPVMLSQWRKAWKQGLP